MSRAPVPSDTPSPPARPGLGRGALLTGLGGLVAGAVTGFLAGSLPVAIVAGFFTGQGLTWIARSRGQERRAAIGINLVLAVLLVGALLIAFRAERVLSWLGIG